MSGSTTVQEYSELDPLNRRGPRPAYPKITAVHSGWADLTARAMVHSVVFSDAPWMRGLLSEPPRGYYRHIGVPDKDREEAIKTWAIHQRWRVVCKRFQAYPSVYMNMCHCTPAAVTISYTKLITCQESKICPWCHARRLIRLFRSLPDLEDGQVYATMELGVYSHQHETPQVSDVIQLRSLVASVRRHVPGSPVIIRNLTPISRTGGQPDAWAVGATLISVVPAGWQFEGAGGLVPSNFLGRVLCSTREQLVSEVYHTLRYPYPVLTRLQTDEQYRALYLLSKCLRDTRARARKEGAPALPARVTDLLSDNIFNKETYVKQLCPVGRRPHKAPDLVGSSQDQG